jgi:hypothetical protein
VRNFITKMAVRHALLKPAPRLISSADGNLDVKVVVASFAKEWRADFRITGLHQRGFLAVTVGKDNERYDCVIPFSRCRGISLRFRFWYRNTEAFYDGVLAYIWGMVSFEAARAELRRSRHQKNYNRSLKIREDRTDVLQEIVDEHLRRVSRDGAPILQDTRIDRLEVAALLYGEELWGHPKHNEIISRLDLVIDSLVESGELKSEQNRVIVQGKAVTTIASRIEEDRKHKDQVQYNASIKFLTFGLLFVSAVQAAITWYKSG